MGKRKYRFEQIAINCTQKKLPTEEDYAGYIGLEHLESGSLNVTRFGSQVPLKGEKLVMHKGDVLFGKRNAYLRRAAVCPHDGIFSAHGMVLQPREDVIDKSFFPLFISSDYFFDEVIRISVGSLSPTVNWKDLKDVEFDLPDLEEQKKLAEVLWSINDVIEAYRRLISTTDSLVKSQFIEMFYGKDYPLKTIGDVVDRNISRVSKVFKQTDEIQYLDISSIDNTTKSVTKLTKYILKDAPSRAQYVLKEGDIVYSTVRPNLQNIAINRSEDKNVVGSTGFCILRCKEVTSGYMWGVVTGAKFTEEMVSRTNGSNYPAVNDKTIYAYKIPIAPIEQQIEFERFVQKIDKSKFYIEKLIQMQIVIWQKGGKIYANI